MKKIILSLTAVAAFSTMTAQELKYKKDKLLLDGVELFTYIRTPSTNEYTLYKLNTKDEIVYVKYDRNGTFEYSEDDYVKLFFAKYNMRIESKSVRFGRDGKELIERLLNEGVISKDGEINEEKLNQFNSKYKDEITK